MNEQPLISEELRFDKNLKLSNPSFKQIILDSVRGSTAGVKDNLYKISWPTDYVFVSLAHRVYSESKNIHLHGKKLEKEMGNWQLLTVAYNDKLLNGYVGAAYWNPDKHQIIIAHRGTKLKDATNIIGAIFSNVKGIFYNQHAYQIDSAVTFTNKVIGALDEIKRDEKYMPHMQLFFTGHSLGGWLAQITTFSAKYVIYDGNNFIMNHRFEERGYHASTVVFDSPGAKKILERIHCSLKDRYDDVSVLNSLDIICYVSVPNVVNSCNLHIGIIYKIFVEFSEKDKKWMQRSAKSYLELTHGIKKFKETFNPHTGRVREDENGKLTVLRMIDWPLLIPEDEEAPTRDKIKWGILQIAKIVADVTIFPKIVLSIGEGLYGLYSLKKWYDECISELNNFFSSANESNDYHNTLEHIKDAGPYRSIRYNYKELDENYVNEHSMNVFTHKEHQFLEIYKLLRQYQKQLPNDHKIRNVFSCLQHIEGLEGKTMEMLNDYEIEDGFIKRSKKLHYFILYIKNLLHFFPKINKEVEVTQKYLPLHILNSFYQTMSSSYVTSIKSNLEIENDILKINDFLENDKTVLHVVQSVTSLGVTIMHKIVSFHIKNKDYRDPIFISLRRLSYLGSSLFTGFLKNITMKYFVIVECNNVLTDSEKMFLHDLLGIVKDKYNIKIALVTERNSLFNRYVSEYLINKKINSQVSDVEIKFSQLSFRSQLELLGTAVMFNGKEVPLKTVLGENCTELNEILDSETILKLVQREVIKIGKTLPQLGSVESYYILRKLSRSLKMRDESFRIGNLENDMFLISSDCNDSLPNNSTVNCRIMGNSSENSQEEPFSRVILLSGENHKDEFRKYCKKYSQLNIHWLRQHKEQWIWQKSRASNLSRYRKYVENCSDNDVCFEIKDSDDIRKFKGKFVIIAAEPGMGKSTFLTFLGNQVANSHLCIRVNLVEYKTGEQDFKTDDDIISFLMGCDSAYSKCDRITRKIVKYCFNRGNCVIFLDGFDEIVEKSQNTIINLLKRLQTTNVGKVFISTRLHFRDKLEDKLSTFAYSFKPFSLKDQEQFLKKFWQCDIDSDVDQISLNKYISELLKFLSHSIGDKERNFMGIPLQMKMVAESFRKHLASSLYSIQCFNAEPNFPNDFDILKLYNCFIDTKYKVYFEKIGGGEIDLSIPGRHNLLTSGLSELHGVLAFIELFPDIDQNMQKFLVNKIPLSQAQKMEVNLVGIFQFINERIIFTHRTFAEYFIAEFLARRLNNPMENAHKYAVEFLSKELFENKNEVIKTFLDYHFAKEQIFVLSLRGNLNSVKNIADINVIDVLGRSALHYASQEGHKNVIDILLRNGVDVNLKDKLGKTALHYAARFSGRAQVVERLLKEASRHFIDEKDNNGFTSLYYAAQQGKWEIVECLILEGADSSVLDEKWLIFQYTYQNNVKLVNAFIEKKVDISFTDKLGNTLLHIAAQRGHIDLLTLLLKNGAKIDVLNNNGVKPISYAAQNEKWNSVELLIQDSNINDLNVTQKDLLLKHSVKNRNWNVVKIFMRDKEQNTYWEYLDNQERIELLCYVIQDKEIVVAEFLITREIEIDRCNCQLKKPIHIAADNELWNIVQQLLRKKPDFSALNKAQKISLLIYSARYASWDILDFFLKNWSDNLYLQHLYDSLNFDEIINCLCYFITCGRLDLTRCVVDELLNTNRISNVNILNKCGKTLLQIAAQGGNLDIVRYLVNEKEADPRHKGHSAISSVLKENHLHVAKFLVEKLSVLDNIPVLHAALQYASNIILEEFLTDNIDIDAKDDQGNTALHLTVTENKLDAVKCLVKYGSNFFLKNCSNKTAFDIAKQKRFTPIEQFLLHMKSCYEKLIQAIKIGDLDKVKLLLKCDNINVNLIYKNKFTLLNFAAGYGHFEILKYLIEQGANVNLCDNYGNTVLHWTTLNKITGVSFFLAYSEFLVLDQVDDSETKPVYNEFTMLSPDTDLTFKDDDVDLDVTWQNDRLCIVKYLVDIKNVDFNLQNNEGVSALHLMAQSGFLSALKYLIDVKSADVYLRDKNGNTILHFAANYKVVYYLIEKIPILLHIKNAHGSTALHAAASHSKLDAVICLVEAGLCCNTQNNNGDTPCHFGAQRRNLNIIKYFLEQNADLFIENCNGNRPGDFALTDDAIALINKKEQESLLNAVETDDFEKVCELIAKGVDINSLNSIGKTPLFCAVEKSRNFELIKYLLAKGADVLAKYDHCTVLHIAIAKQESEIVELLLNTFLDIVENPREQLDAKDSEGNTPLMWAAEKRNFSALQLLSEYGADINATNNDGMTALHLASQCGYPEIVQILLDVGADACVTDNEGRKPIHVAAQHGHLDVVGFFVSRKVNILEKDRDGWNVVHYAVCNNKLDDIINAISIKDTLNTEGNNGRSVIELLFTVVVHREKYPQNILHPNDLNSTEVELFDIFEHLDNFSRHLTLDVTGIVETIIQQTEVSRDKGRYNESLELFNRILSWQEIQDALGPDHPTTLKTRTNIAELLSKLGKYDEALQNLIKIHNIQQHFRDHYSDLLITYRDIAEVLYKQGKYDEALRRYNEVLEERKTLGPNHPEVLITRFHIARVINNQEKHEEALKSFQDIFHLQKTTLGDTHPDTLKTQHNINFTLFRLCRPVDEFFDDAYDVLKKRVDRIGNDHPDCLTSQHFMALLMHKKGETEIALVGLQSILNKQKSILGEDHPDTLATEEDLAVIKLKNGERAEALNMLRSVLERKKNVLGKDHLYTSYTERCINSSGRGCVIQ